MAITDLYVNNPDDRAVVYPSWALRISSDRSDSRLTLYDDAVAGQYLYDQPSKKSQVNPLLRPRKVSWTAGGGQMDYAQVDWMSNDPIINRMSQPSSFVRMCDVLLPSRAFLGDDDADLIDPETGKISDEAKAFRYGGNVRLILGDYLTESETVSSTESLTAQIAVVDTYFGQRVTGFQWLVYYEADETDPAAYFTNHVPTSEIVFNPVIDGVVKGNKSSTFSSFDHYWIDHSIGDSAAAQRYVGQSVSEWTLPEAIKRLCLMCNEREYYVLNPVIDYEDEIWNDAPALKNVVLETGYHLPFYLDALLHPNGYNWFLDPQTKETTTDSSGDNHSYEKPIIRIFKRGWSPDPPKELNFQPPASSLDLSKSNVNEYSIDRTIADAYNGVRVLGSPIMVELTLELHPGWRESEDELTADQLSMSTGSMYAAHRTAHRLWIANEWGGFSELREDRNAHVEEFSLFFGYLMPDATGAPQKVFGSNETTIRKRVLGPPLTYHGIGEDRIRRDVLLQIQSRSVTGLDKWVEVTSEIGSWAVLDDQIGIYFNDDKPPEVLMEAWKKDYVRLRVTGTIESDANIYNKFTEFPPDAELDLSVVGRLRSLTVNKENEFRLWYVLGKNGPDPEIQDDHPMASVLKDDPAGAETRDDRQALVDYGKAILNNVRHAEYSANFTLPGWHTEYRIGDLLSKINGREIGLNQSADPADPRYLQITGVEWEHSEDGPVTRLIVDRGMNTAETTKTPESGAFQSPPLEEAVRFQVEGLLRKETEKMTNSLSMSSVAMDRLRGVVR
jgi:hypothetical protein